MATDTHTTTTADAHAKADSLLQEVKAFVLSHETPSDVFNELLRIIGEGGPTARNVRSTRHSINDQ